MNTRGTDLKDPPVTIFLLDDHEIVRHGLRDLFESEDDLVVVGESGSAKEAERIIPALRPHVAVLDARLPDGSGIDVCRSIRSRDPSIRGVILTSYDDDEALFASIMAGASGYVLKQVKSGELVRAIRAVGQGQSLLDPEVTSAVLDRLRKGKHLLKDEKLARLSPQEERILLLIADGSTNKEIGEQLNLAEKTVKNYVSSILAKLGMERRTQAATFVVRLDQGDQHPG